MLKNLKTMRNAVRLITVLIILTLVTSNWGYARAPTQHKKLTTKSRIIKTAHRLGKLKAKVKSKIEKLKEKTIEVANFTMDMTAYRINDSNHKSYNYFHDKFEESVTKFSRILPRCSQKGMLSSCSKLLFVARQWIDAYLQNSKIKKCKVPHVREDLSSLNKLFMSKFLVAAEYPDSLVRKFESADANYFTEVEDQIEVIVDKLPRCF